MIWCLLHEVIAAVADSEEVVVFRAPAEGCYLLSAHLLRVKIPQRQKRALAFLEQVRLIVPIAKVLHNLVKRVLVHHALYRLERAAHGRAVDNVGVLYELLLPVLLVLTVTLLPGLLLVEGGLLLADSLALDIFHVGVKYIALCDGVIEAYARRRFGNRSTFPIRIVELYRAIS
jgi:hypothetical protein